MKILELIRTMTEMQNLLEGTRVDLNWQNKTSTK